VRDLRAKRLDKIGIWSPFHAATDALCQDQHALLPGSETPRLYGGGPVSEERLDRVIEALEIIHVPSHPHQLHPLCQYHITVVLLG
jgi:hypothetical protein